MSPNRRDSPKIPLDYASIVIVTEAAPKEAGEVVKSAQEIMLKAILLQRLGINMDEGLFNIDYMQKNMINAYKADRRSIDNTDLDSKAENFISNVKETLNDINFPHNLAKTINWSNIIDASPVAKKEPDESFNAGLSILQDIVLQRLGINVSGNKFSGFGNDKRKLAQIIAKNAEGADSNEKQVNALKAADKFVQEIDSGMDQFFSKTHVKG